MRRKASGAAALVTGPSRADFSRSLMGDRIHHRLDKRSVTVFATSRDYSKEIPVPVEETVRSLWHFSKIQVHAFNGV